MNIPSKITLKSTINGQFSSIFNSFFYVLPGRVLFVHSARFHGKNAAGIPCVIHQIWNGSLDDIPVEMARTTGQNGGKWNFLVIKSSD